MQNFEDELRLVERLDRPEKINAGHSIRRDTCLSSVPRLISELSADKANIGWIWEGYLAKGHLTFFSALWKVGKSTLIAYLLRNIQSSDEFLGQKISFAKTLVLSEESETIWARRRDDLSLTGEIYLSCRPIVAKLNYRQWQDFINTNLKFCEEKGIELVIVDTISTFWPVRDEGNNPELDAAIIPLTTFLEKGIAVMLIHHFRKSGGQEGTATRGGGGLGSRADILCEFTRLEAENIHSTKRVLRSYSRFEETPAEIVVELFNGKYVARGTKADVSREMRLQNVLSILSEIGPEKTISEIAEGWDNETFGNKPSSRTIRRYIETLLGDGRVAQAGTKMVGRTITPIYSIRQDS